MDQMSQFCRRDIWDAQTPDVQRLLLSFRIFPAPDENFDATYIGILPSEQDEKTNMNYADLAELARQYEKMAMENLKHVDMARREQRAREEQKEASFQYTDTYLEQKME